MPVVADTWDGDGVSVGIVKHQWSWNTMMIKYYSRIGVTGWWVGGEGISKKWAPMTLDAWVNSGGNIDLGWLWWWKIFSTIMTTEESHNNDSCGRYMVWWWCQCRYCKTSVELKYNDDKILQQNRSHGMIISGVDSKRNGNVSSYKGKKIFRTARAAVAEVQGNWDYGRKYYVWYRQKRRRLFKTSKMAQE